MANSQIEPADFSPVFSSPRAGPDDAAQPRTVPAEGGRLAAGASQGDGHMLQEWLIDRLDQLEFAIADSGGTSAAQREMADGGRRLDRLERVVERLAFLFDDKLAAAEDSAAKDPNAEVVAALEDGLDRLGATVSTVSHRLDALANRVGALSEAAESRSAAATASVSDRFDRLHDAIQVATAGSPDAAEVCERLDQVGGLVEVMTTRLDAMETRVTQTLQSDEADSTLAVRFEKLEQAISEVGTAVQTSAEPAPTGDPAAPLQDAMHPVQQTVEALCAQVSDAQALAAQRLTAIDSALGALGEAVSTVSQQDAMQSDIAMEDHLARIEATLVSLQEVVTTQGSQAAEQHGAAHEKVDALFERVTKFATDTGDTLGSLISRPEPVVDVSPLQQEMSQVAATLSAISEKQDHQVSVNTSVFDEVVQNVRSLADQGAAAAAFHRTLGDWTETNTTALQKAQDKLDSVLAGTPDISAVQDQIGDLKAAIARIADDALPALQTLLARPVASPEAAAQRQGLERLSAAFASLAERQDDVAARIEQHLSGLSAEISAQDGDLHSEAPETATAAQVADLMESLVRVGTRLDDMDASLSQSDEASHQKLETLLAELEGLREEVSPRLQALIEKPAPVVDMSERRQSFARLAAALSTMAQRQSTASDTIVARLGDIETQLSEAVAAEPQKESADLSDKIDAVVAAVADLHTGTADATEASLNTMALTKMSGQLAAVLTRLNALNRLSEGQAAELRARLGDMPRGEDLVGMKGELGALRDQCERLFEQALRPVSGEQELDAVAFKRQLGLAVAEVLADAERRESIA